MVPIGFGRRLSRSDGASGVSNSGGGPRKAQERISVLPGARSTRSLHRPRAALSEEQPAAKSAAGAPAPSVVSTMP
ncbi:MAG: hypothetical protein U0263_34065 [Polyangiaceae bacterium]